MVKLSIVSMTVLSVLLAIALMFGGLGWAVREGKTDEKLLWLPPQGKYQLIVRIGPDALPWAGRWGQPRQMAINIWAHGRGTDWHVIKLVGIPLGMSAEPAP